MEQRGGPTATETTPTQPELTSLVAPGSGAETPTLPAGGKQKVKAGQRNVVSQVTGTRGENVSLPKIGPHEPIDAREEDTLRHIDEDN